MQQLTFFFISLLCLFNHLNGQAFDIEHLYPIENSHSFIQFEVTYMGYAKVRGNFGNFHGSIYYNPAALEQTSVTFQIDVNSINTNNDWRDGDLKSDNWFSAATFPYIHFSSDRVKATDDGLLVSGDLTIKETTKRIEFHLSTPLAVEDIRGDDQLIFTGGYALNRKEYGVMGKNWSRIKEGIAALSDEVKIEFSLLGKQINEENFSNFLRNPQRPPGGIYAAYQSGGLTAAVDKYEVMQADTSIALNSRALNMVGYMLVQQEKLADAQVLFERNLVDFPEDGNAYDAMGELYLRIGNTQDAIMFYQKSLERDPQNMNAAEVLKHLERR